MEINTLKELARSRGFQLFGIAPAVIPEKDKENINLWIEEKRYGSMSWFEKNKHLRLNFESLGFEVASVIVLGILYRDVQYSRIKQTLDFKISSYALGKDYHTIIKQKSLPILQFLRERFPEKKFRQGVDSLPVAEKILGREAGLGWIGKNTNLIHSDRGSFFFLSVILSEVELEKTNQLHPDRCGTCRKCVDACPTGALEEYKIDARKCISYLTIENKEEEFSKETKKDLSGWVYGCDICQEVCPWNREKRGSKLFTEEKDFYVKSEWKTMSREKLKKLTEEEFLNLVRTSAMQRISYKQFLRNLKSE